MEFKGGKSLSKGLGVYHPRGLIHSISKLLADPPTLEAVESSNLFDVALVCRDGVVPWNKFLLAANSPLLRQSWKESDGGDAESTRSIILLPDMSTSTVSSMLKCTVNPAVRSDTLSVNEQEIMKLLGFELMLLSTERNQHTIEEDDNLDSISLLSGPLSVSEVDSQDLPPETDPKLTPENKVFKSASEKCFDRESVINTPTLSVPDEAEHKKEEPKPSKPHRSLVCPSCGLRFQRLLHLQRHQSSHNPSNQLKCQRCEKVFHHPDNLRLHEKYHEDRDEEKECEDCGEKLRGSRALKSHMERLHSPGISCPVCNKFFTSKRLLKRHQQRVHDEDVESDVFCHLCGKGFGSAQAMMVHKRSHSQGQPEAKPSKYVRCEQCQKLFASDTHLKLHVRRTHAAVPKKCPDCDKNVKDLRKHQQQCHAEGLKAPVAEDKSVECADCGQTFSSKYVLRSHVKRVHDVAKDFQCSSCSKLFVTNTSLRRHVREVHGENSFECDDCGLFFPVRHSLERHIRHVHHPTRYPCPYCSTPVVHLAAHFTTAHKMAAEEARTLAEEVSGKSAARTDFPLSRVLKIKKD